MSSKSSNSLYIKSFPIISKKITGNGLQGEQGPQGEQGLQGEKRITHDIVIPTSNNYVIEHTYDGSIIMIIPSDITGLTLNLTIEDVADNTMYEQDVLFDGDNVQNSMITSLTINGEDPITITFSDSSQQINTISTQKINLYRIDSIWKYAFSTTDIYVY